MIRKAISRIYATSHAGSSSKGTRQISSQSLGAALQPGRFGAVNLEWEHVPEQLSKTPSAVFETAIEEALQGAKSAVWCTLSLQNGAALAAAIASGLKAHHTSADGLSIVLYKWLADAADPVPPYASHQIGMAGLVVDNWDPENARLLLVNERHKNTIWKFPGGLVDVGEDLDVAVTRELQEEVGVPCAFHGLLGLRHQHRMAWGVSDMCIVSLCSVAPDAPRASDGSVVLTPDGTEVLDAKWHSLAEFAGSNSHPLNGWAAKTALRVLQDGVQDSSCLITHHQIPSVTQKNTSVNLYAAASALR